jgi:DNA polymerase sigma
MPSLKPLLLVVKQFLNEQGLNDIVTGGISSYCLIIILIAYLQSLRGVTTVHARDEEQTDGVKSSGSWMSDSPAPALPPSPSPALDLGGMLIGFLDLMGRHLDFSRTGIRLNLSTSETTSCFFALPPAPPGVQHPPMTVVDPLDLTHNVGKGSYSIWRVQQVCHQALVTLSAAAMMDDRQTPLLSLFIRRANHGDKDEPPISNHGPNAVGS